MERHCFELAPSVPCNGTCHYIHFTVQATVWWGGCGHQTGQSSLATCCISSRCISSRCFCSSYSLEKYQENMKHYAKLWVRKPFLRPGEKVKERIKNPFHVRKAHSRVTRPVTVTKKVGPNSSLLSDGKTWNASHLPSVCDRTRLQHDWIFTHVCHWNSISQINTC